MHTVNSLGTPIAAYAAAPQQGGFAPPGAVELQEPEEIPRERDDASGEPPPDLLGGSGSGAGDAGTGPPADHGHAGAVYRADGLLAGDARAGGALDLLAV